MSFYSKRWSTTIKNDNKCTVNVKNDVTVDLGTEGMCTISAPEKQSAYGII